MGKPADVPTIDGFDTMDDAALRELSAHMGLAMSFDDLKFVQTYFRDEENVTRRLQKSGSSIRIGLTIAAIRRL